MCIPSPAYDLLKGFMTPNDVLYLTLLQEMGTFSGRVKVSNTLIAKSKLRPLSDKESMLLYQAQNWESAIDRLKQAVTGKALTPTKEAGMVDNVIPFRRKV